MVCFCSILSAIYYENLRHSVSQSDAKLKSIATWAHVFFRGLGNLLYIFSIWVLIGSNWQIETKEISHEAKVKKHVAS